ncbi:MAG: type II toxin-antitoxin system YafQ family toxin [Bacteroidales bacterium]|nr:type II toxin-antitoxin system YafQ family toxin [Bacteroidales bacterium]
MRDIVITTKYKKDYKAAVKQNLPIDKLDEIIKKLQQDISLPIQNKDHQLEGTYKDCRECHINPDWLLIYQKNDCEKSELRILTLVRLGSHSKLFKK